MGYAPSYFRVHVSNWIRQGWLPKSGALAEFGAQELDGEVSASRKDVSTFLTSLGEPSEQAEDFAASLVFPCPSKQIYDRAGIECASLDVNGFPGTTRFDLSTERVPAELLGHFDMVNNEGTIEHLCNPVNAFHVAHDLVKAGGVMRHSIPLSGWHMHGILYPSLEFYCILAATNSYNVLYALVELNRYEADFLGDFNRQMHRPSQGQAEGANEWTKAIVPRSHVESFPGLIPVADLWLHITFRKPSDRPFVLPVVHLEKDYDGAVYRQLVENYRALAAKREEGGKG